MPATAITEAVTASPGADPLPQSRTGVWRTWTGKEGAAIMMVAMVVVTEDAMVVVTIMMVTEAAMAREVTRVVEEVAAEITSVASIHHRRYPVQGLI